MQVFEAGDDVGGTWYWNRYPGARCDSESYIYCYSFDKDLMQEWEWSGKYPEQPEILRYLNHVADRFDLRRNIKFDTRVTGGPLRRGDQPLDGRDRPGRPRSRPSTSSPPSAACRAGQVPNIPGLDSFQGDWYHTGAWPHEGVDFTGKRVGVIGTGLERRAVDPGDRQAGRAPHGVPAHAAVHRPGPPRHGRQGVPRRRQDATTTTIYEQCPLVARRACRTRCIERSALSVSDEERDAIYEAAWQEGGFKFILAHVQRHRRRPPGQRHGVGVHPRQDPRDGQGPRGRREARARSTTRSRRSGR